MSHFLVVILPPPIFFQAFVEIKTKTGPLTLLLKKHEFGFNNRAKEHPHILLPKAMDYMPLSDALQESKA